MNSIEIFKKIKLFLFDMDGTLYLGDRLFPFTKELLATIKQQGARYLFMTNNSSKSVDAYIEKLAGFGIEATEDAFVTKKTQNEIKTRILAFGYERLTEAEKKRFFYDVVERNRA